MDYKTDQADMATLAARYATRSASTPPNGPSRSQRRMTYAGLYAVRASELSVDLKGSR